MGNGMQESGHPLQVRRGDRDQVGIGGKAVLKVVLVHLSKWSRGLRINSDLWLRCHESRMIGRKGGRWGAIPPTSVSTVAIPVPLPSAAS